MVSLSEWWSRRLLTPSHPLRGCGSEVMTTQRRFLVVLMTTLMLAASLAGCLVEMMVVVTLIRVLTTAGRQILVHRIRMVMASLIC